MKRELDFVDEFLKTLKEKYGFQAQELEFGPGLAVSYFESESYDEKEFLSQFSALLENLAFQGQITLEMGRAIAASCGTYVTKVVDRKTNHSGNFAIVDGGMHQLVYYGQFMAMNNSNSRISSYSMPERSSSRQLVEMDRVT